MALIDTIEKVQGQTLDQISDTQQRALDLNEKVAEALKDRVPPVKLPFASALPTPAESIKLYFDFAGKLLATNRKFAESFVSAWVSPVAKAAPKARAKASA